MSEQDRKIIDYQAGARVLDVDTTPNRKGTVTRAAHNINERPRLTVQYDDGGFAQAVHPIHFIPLAEEP